MDIVMPDGPGSPPDSTVPDEAGRNAPTPRDALTDRQVFVVVDVETTGLDPLEARITEIAAVRVRGGEVVAEFATLVAPGVPIPAFITALTGISDAMTAGAPPLRLVLPAFLDFARDDVLVAHNAPFDVGFLRTACTALDLVWPDFTVVDTLTLARGVLEPGEVRNNKLVTLAEFFAAPSPPAHRAAADCHATAHVLRSLLRRLHEDGVHDLPGLVARATPPPR